MIAIAQSSTQRDPIVFTNQWVECSRVVKRALDIIYTSEVDEIDEDNLNSNMYVVDFARKWDITVIRTLMANQIRLSATKDKSPAFELLLISLKMNDNALAASAFGSRDREMWLGHEYAWICEPAGLDDAEVVLPPNYQSEPYSRRPSRDAKENPKGGDIFDLGASAYEWSIQLPPTVTWIILRSQHLSVHSRNPAQEHFKRLMDLYCE